MTSRTPFSSAVAHTWPIPVAFAAADDEVVKTATSATIKSRLVVKSFPVRA